MNEGPACARFGVPGINNDVEDILRQGYTAGKVHRLSAHLCHCSTKDSVRMVELAKADGVDVSAEVCPHHFTLTEDDIQFDDANYKMNPPLRSKEDRRALVEGLCKGIMDTIATDHAPHHKDEKAKGIASAPFGIVGLETAFALTMTELVHTGHLTPMEMVKRLSYTPAKILGIEKGTLKEGSVADITICHPDWEYTVNPESFFSMGKNTPFGGYKARGKVVKTMVSGKIVYEMKR